MKRNVILIMSLIFTSVIFGQNISLPELIKLNNYSFDEFGVCTLTFSVDLAMKVFSFPFT